MFSYQIKIRYRHIALFKFSIFIQTVVVYSKMVWLFLKRLGKINKTPRKKSNKFNRNSNLEKKLTVKNYIRVWLHNKAIKPTVGDLFEHFYYWIGKESNNLYLWLCKNVMNSVSAFALYDWYALCLLNNELKVSLILHDWCL